MLMSRLNELNHSLSWWSYTFTAKNPLSSSLFYQLVDTVFAIELINSHVSAGWSVYIMNARQSQRVVITRFFNNQLTSWWLLQGLRVKLQFLKLYALCKSSFLVINSFINAKKITERLAFSKSKIGLLTFLDGSNRRLQDPYFGHLLDQINHADANTAQYIFYLNRPLYKRGEEISAERNQFSILFQFLRVADIFGVITKVIKEFFSGYHDQLIVIDGIETSLYPLIDEHRVAELSRGYSDNLLVFFAAKNIARNNLFELIVYPFENKSLEKCFLMGLDNKVTTIGYQHSSITPRHFCFKFYGNESAITPLPKKVVTLGSVTKEWLINAGLPSAKIQSGYSLRHNLHTELVKSPLTFPQVKLLFAFSSGLSEVVQTIHFLRPLIAQFPTMTYRFRNHVNFPISMLDGSDYKWVKDYAESEQKTSLIEDFDWADIVVYISSTVALEALFCGIPAIRLNLDVFNSDPLLKRDIPYRWQCNECSEFFDTIKEIANLSHADRMQRIADTKEYINEYLRKGEAEEYKIFLTAFKKNI